MNRLSLALAAILLASAPAVAHEYKLGDLTIDHPMIFATTPVSRSTGGFFTITNTGTTDDALLDVRADFPRIELHTTEMTDGVARMLRQERIEVPAGQTVALQRGGYHVMLMGLTDQLTPGEEIPATLVFENAGAIDVVFNVEDRDGDAADAHADHD